MYGGSQPSSLTLCGEASFPLAFPLEPGADDDEEEVVFLAEVAALFVLVFVVDTALALGVTLAFFGCDR